MHDCFDSKSDDKKILKSPDRAYRRTDIWQ